MYKVIENRYIGEDMYLMRIEGKFEGKMGQFYMIRAWDKFPLLSRPISIHDIDESSINNIGYEIPFTRHFYKYEELRTFTDIMKEVESLESEIALEIRKVLV